MKKLVIYVFLFSLVMLNGCGSGKNNQVADNGTIPEKTTVNKPGLSKPNNSKSSTPASNDTKEKGGLDWRKDDLLAVAFLGYNMYEDLEVYSQSQDLADFLYYYPEIEEFEILDTGSGDEIYLIIPRFYDSKVEIKENSGKKKSIYKGNDKPVLLQTNLGDLRADLEVIVSHGDERIAFFPIVDGMDSTVILPEYGVFDISSYDSTLIENDIYDITYLDGDWSCNYKGPGGKERHIALSFGGLSSMELDGWYELSYQDLTDGSQMDGACYFRSPADFWEPSDDTEKLLYIELVGDSKDGRYQMFGKFRYEFLDEETLILRHFSFDPLKKREEGYEYMFVRTYG